MNAPNPEVDVFFENIKKWKAELEQLRIILRDCGLTEDLKWKQPCYSFKGKNICIIGGFKDFCVLSFFKGVLLQDKAGILVKQGENTQSARIVKITELEQITTLKATLKAYIFEAIEVEKAGIEVPFKSNDELVLVEELQTKLDADVTFKAAFTALTPGRQRAYNLYFSGAKQAKSRLDRIEKYTPKILSGKGINDCTCGHSKRMPTCDGSHKYL
ncbi:DUF1801 domain-containing protein [Lacihabitans lacunae]|uniref:DUF1801 domain-containing protein n=1 Tax=Lacihabitans lacunae TaxID=1028214 RepID=A0ABV7YZP6_9BACT